MKGRKKREILREPLENRRETPEEMPEEMPEEVPKECRRKVRSMTICHPDPFSLPQKRPIMQQKRPKSNGRAVSNYLVLALPWPSDGSQNELSDQQ